MATFSEWLIRALGGFVNHLAALGPEDVGLNTAFSAIVIAAAIGLRWAAPRLVRSGLHRLRTPDVVEQMLRARMTRIFAVLFDTLVSLVAAYLVLRVWGLDLTAWAKTGAGAAMGREFWRLLVLVVLAAVAYELAAISISRLMSPLAVAATNPRRAAQLRTLTPILRGVAQATVVVVAGLTLLSEIGVQIAPLLAGAGVLGVAVGFGAQNLVKDFLTGLFLVLEDVVSVGDTVQIATSSGRVEAMTLRTIRLRDFDGTLHIFPYSEAQVIHNATNLFAYAVVNVPVVLGADIDKAIEVMRQTGEALARDPEIGKKVLQPIEVLGVDSLNGASVALKGRIKTLPSARDEVTRAFYQRLKPALEKSGIELSRPAA